MPNNNNNYYYHYNYDYHNQNHHRSISDIRTEHASTNAERVSHKQCQLDSEKIGGNKVHHRYRIRYFLPLDIEQCL